VLYGRNAERALLVRLLEGARASRSAVLVVRGEPGIGKTALLDEALLHATGMHVLTARGVRSESELPFAALHQLVRPVLSYIDRVPEPQAQALRAAFGLRDDPRQERFLAFTGCLSLLSELAEEQPVLCVIDDAHWLDAASADALQFVARRLDREGIVLLFAVRDDELGQFDSIDLPSLALEGLDAEACGALLSAGSGVDAAPHVRDRLVAQTRGNALALLEVPAALTSSQLAGLAPLPDSLPLTRQVESVFLDRARRLPADTQRLLLLAAADESESVLLLRRAAPRYGVDPIAMDTAEKARLLSITDTKFTFRHPLVRSAIYDAATSSDRRAAHRALAEALTQDEEQADRRAWHLAASAVDPDEAIVLALEEAAARAEARGGHLASAKALERAADLSADGVARGRRLVQAARAASTSGADEQAVSLAVRAQSLVSDPMSGAGIAFVLAISAINRGRPLDVVPLLLDAAGEITRASPRTALELLVYATVAASEGGDVAAQREIVRLAAAVSTPDGDDDWSRFVVPFLEGSDAMNSGDPARGAPLLEQAVAWALAGDDERHLFWASIGAMWVGSDQRTLDLSRRAVALARQRGAISVLTPLLGARAGQLFLAQHLDDALLAADEAVRLARDVRAENWVLLPQCIQAGIAAIRGEDDEARRLAEAVLEPATARGLVVKISAATAALSLVELGRGRWSEALVHLDTVSDVGQGRGGPLGATVSAPNRIEAAVRAGELDKAQHALENFERWASYSGAPWATPRLASCRALVSTGQEATAHFEEALRHSQEARPFDLGRIHLLYGEHLRRERRRIDSRTQLRVALDIFERLRAGPWAERARAELRASGETARKRQPNALAQLTPQELQIARYVASGLSNKEVAAQLFLSPRTIDAHLRGVFAKLAITSRTQLARQSLGEEAALAMSR